MSDVATRLGTHFEVRAIQVGERVDVKGIEPRLTPHQPVIIEVATHGYAVLIRAGAIVLFGVDQLQQERVIADLGPRIIDKSVKTESERALVRIGEADGVEPDAIIIRELTLDRLQVIAEILGKSVILGRYELEIAEAFQAIEPLARQMKSTPTRVPWRQRDLVRNIGHAMDAEQALVGRAEVLEKPDLLWDNPELDRMYARLEDEYELRERHLALDTKLTVVARAAQTMLDLHQAKRALNVEYYIVALIVFEIGLAVIQLLK
ncbi:MAG TPA: RMD1 family protein [Kofleriaceae bacterium]